MFYILFFFSLFLRMYSHKLKSPILKIFRELWKKKTPLNIKAISEQFPREIAMYQSCIVYINSLINLRISLLENASANQLNVR